jgi:two-component system phosphate regulon sensor histidine kinase PhoR
MMRRDFIANASHELRTPLTVINGFLEIAQRLSRTWINRKPASSHLKLHDGAGPAHAEPGRRHADADATGIHRLSGARRARSDMHNSAGARSCRKPRHLSGGRHDDFPQRSTDRISKAVPTKSCAARSATSSPMPSAIHAGERWAYRDCHGKPTETGPAILGSRHRDRHSTGEHISAGLTERFYRVDQKPIAGDAGYRPGARHRQARAAAPSSKLGD